MSKIVNLITEHINIFDLFTNVYIFGSSISNNKHPNDIDVLLVYSIYSDEIQNEKRIISLILEKLFNLPIDITILSEKELEETKFLEKLSFNYKKLK
jgi:predicted nucleotidyltransferase